MTFTESNTVEQMILNAVTRVSRTVPPLVREKSPGYGESLPMSGSAEVLA
jgi:hypothetical protein